MIKDILLGAVLPAILVATGLGVLIGLQSPEPEKNLPIPDTRSALLAEMPAAEVEQVRALTELSQTLDIPVRGNVVPYREIQLASEVTGRIVEKNPDVRGGNVVRKDTVLYRIDPQDYQLDVERLTQRLAQERAALVELEQDIANAEALLDVAQQELQLARADVSRLESLREGIRSQAEVDQAQRAVLASLNQQVSLQNQIRLFQTRRARLESAAELAETELEQAQLNLERTTIRAPVEGRIVSEHVDSDSYVQRGTLLLVIEDISKVEVACNVRMDQLYWVLDQQAASAEELATAAHLSRSELPKLPVKVRYELSGRQPVRYEWLGRLDRYEGGGLDPQSRTVPLRVLVDEPNRFTINGKPSAQAGVSGPPALVRGMFVDAVIQAQPATPLLLVPKLSIKPATGTSVIWKFIPDSAAMEVKRQELKAKKRLADTGQEAGVSKTDMERGSPVDSSEWQEGFLRTVTDVQVVGPFNPDLMPSSTTPISDPDRSLLDASSVEYWICEVPTQALGPGDSVVVTPLPGAEAEGDEVIRVRRSTLPAGNE